MVDLETTGLTQDAESEIVEVGIVLLDRGLDRFTTATSLVRPARPLPRVVQRITGLRNADLEKAGTIAELVPELQRLLWGRTLVAHNADFERHFLSRALGVEFENCRYLDTLDLLAITHPDAPDLRLESFTRRLLGTEESHRALDDALDTARVLAQAAAGARRGEVRYVAARRAFEIYAADSPWLALLAGDNELVLPPTLESAFVEIPSTDEVPVPFDEDAIVAALSDEARGRRHFPGYRVRSEQIRLARSFVRTLADGGRALLEGGTGVGKSLAYLAAAIPYALERAEGGIREPVIISTRTKLLQDQLLEKDIGAAAAFLGRTGLRALSIKGRANYVCERRLSFALEEGREPSIFAADRLSWAALFACARTRPHGEIGSVPGALLRRYPQLRQLLRRSVSPRAELCTREQCAKQRDCPFGRRRAALAKAHLAVANHDLLLRWPPDYPPFTHVIVDEVHELADVADDAYALEVRPEEVLDRFDEIFGSTRDRRRRGSLLPPPVRRAAERDALAWRRALQQDLVSLGRSLQPLAGEFGEVQLPRVLGPEFEGPTEIADAAATRLELIVQWVDELMGEDPAEEETVGLDRATADLRLAAQGLGLAFAESSEDSVAVFENVGPPHDRWRLVVRLVSPAGRFHHEFLDRRESFSGVSASLFIGGDSFAALGELEIEERARDGIARESVPSPFPYATHMRTVALASRGDLVDETAHVLEALARRLGGRTLGLFTSLQRLHQVAELLSVRLREEGIAVLTPRRVFDDPSALVERFRRGSAVLLGARKFWQGLDLQGDALQAVVIEKLPFEVPTELRMRRRQRLEQLGVDAFDRYELGKMLLNLKQMSGRLIRSEEDRGIVVIVDGRTEKNYFPRVAEALPPGCDVTVITGRDELPKILEEVGI